MSDQNHTQPPRTELLAVVLTLVGLAGLAVTVGGPGLWPGFFGERAYSAHLITSDAEPPTSSAAAQYVSAWTPPPPQASDEITLRTINETARSACQSESRAARRAVQQAEAARRQQRRAKPPACQSRPTLLTATVSGLPGVS